VKLGARMGVIAGAVTMFSMNGYANFGPVSPMGAPQPANWSPPAHPGSVPWSIVILLTLLTLIPAILLSMTPFVRLLICFHFLRQALGTQSTPSNQTLIGLALILTWFLLQPTATAIQEQAIAPFQQNRVSAMQAVELGSRPLKQFMLRYVREKDVALFVEFSGEPRPTRPADLPMRVVAPAYLLSELKAGFQIGAVLFLPFLVVDLVVAAVTTSVGMLQLPPVVISTPLKIRVTVDNENFSDRFLPELFRLVN
jgi:flagellar biosynthetic protein FliP